MNIAAPQAWPEVSEADALLIYVALRIQISRTQHETATRNFGALCKHVDREGSPLHGMVLECYPSGSFATGTAIVSKARTNQHDVDVVMEVDVQPDTPPARVLDLLFEAINGDEGSRYNGKVTRNSRCVTVEYEDGTTVDLMPVARFADGPPRAGNLFHHKAEAHEAYHKPVNPWGFKEHFNDSVEFDPAFHKMFEGQRILAEGRASIKAETQPMPEHERLEEKSPRVVALQLIKRKRDLAFRAGARKGWRKPPAVALGAMALDAGPVEPRLVDEVIAVATHIRQRLSERNGPRGTVHVSNPAYRRDNFTDRWPESFAHQQAFDADLRRLIIDMYRLRNENLSMEEKREILQQQFGETAANHAIEKNLDARLAESEAGRLRMGPRGKVLTGTVSASAGAATAAKAATKSGGGFLPE
jgi:hypothetical protein